MMAPILRKFYAEWLTGEPPHAIFTRVTQGRFLDRASLEVEDFNIRSTLATILKTTKIMLADKTNAFFAGGEVGEARIRGLGPHTLAEGALRTTLSNSAEAATRRARELGDTA